MAAQGVLTPRQRDCLMLVAAGRKNREIAAALGIGRWTVAHHLTDAYRRLGVANRTGAAVALWRERGER